MPKGYTNKTSLENYMLTFIDETFDSQLDRWFEAAEEYIDNYTGRSFSVDDTETSRFYNGRNSPELRIDDADEITMLKIDDEEVDLEDVTTYPYNKKPIKKLILQNGWFTKGIKNIEVEANWGSSVPAQIEHVANVIVAGIINYAKKGSGAVQAKTIGRYSVTYNTEKQEGDFNSIDKILKQYKKYTF